MKDLSRLGRDLNKVIIVDNSPASYIFHPDNAVSTLFLLEILSDVNFFFLNVVHSKVSLFLVNIWIH